MIDQTAQRTMQVPGQGLIPRGRPTIDYKEYPKMMTHPQYQPGKPSAEVKSPHGFTYHGIGTPIRFPPVLVKTPDDEAYHASLGYESQGKCDAAAFDRAVGVGQIPDQTVYKPLEYPKWVQGKLCNTAEEEQKVLGGPTMTQIVAEDAHPAIDDEINSLAQPAFNTAAPSSYVDKTLDQLRIEDLEAKVDRLTELLAKAIALPASAEFVPLVPKPPYEVEHPSTFHRVTAAAEAEVRRRIAPKKAASKKARKPVVRTAQQKRDHSEAIKAGLARKKALTESKPSEQADDTPVT